MQFTAGEIRSLIREAFGDAYRILGVSKGASPDDLKSAYRKLAVSLHPDRNRDRDTTRDMVKINAAYTLLSDPTNRRRYDVMGDKTVDTFDAPASAAPRSPPPTPVRPPPPRSRPQPRPEPAYQSRASQAKRRYFTFIEPGIGSRGSKKFWWVERVPGHHSAKFGWGRIGTEGQVITKTYSNHYAALNAVEKAIGEKLAKGYREHQPSPGPGYAESAAPPKSPPPTPGTSTPPRQEKPASPSPGGKKLYKVYPNGPPGDRAGSRLHTGFKGRFYKSPIGTKFNRSDRVEVELGADGKLKVKDPTSGHTQSWGEGLDLLADLIFEMTL